MVAAGYDSAASESHLMPHGLVHNPSQRNQRSHFNDINLDAKDQLKERIVSTAMHCTSVS
jgi:hypothetical protein